MNVAATAIKSELVQLAKGGSSEAKLRLRRYLQHSGFFKGNAIELPASSTSELSLDTEMLFHLISLNELEPPQTNSKISTPSTPECESPRRLRLFSTLCSKIKRGIFHHCHRRQRHNVSFLNVYEEEQQAAVNDGRQELDEKLGLTDSENGSSLKGDSPSSVQTVIQNDNLIMITPPVFPADPKPTTNILRLI